ncbi:MAG: low molecular weight phosphatase family protein [Bacteroidota bacterium]
MYISQILFLCTGNYYRSRTAEELFNHLAIREQLPWRADSMGLREDMSASKNVGPMSSLAIQFLEEREVPIVGIDRMPKSVGAGDFTAFERIICLDEAEHRPKMEERFPFWANRVEYWDVPDLHVAPETYALPRLHEHIVKLLEELTLEGFHDLVRR